MSKFDILLIAHLVGDYLFQTNWMAHNKMKQWAPLAVHSFIYTLVVWAISVLGFGGLSWSACFLIFFSHLILDQRSVVNLWTKHMMGMKNGEPSWLKIVVDQIFHLLILAFAITL